MRILVIGGTRFVGRHVVEQALARGHNVTLFHRGRTGADLFPDVEHRLGDRDSDLSALASGEAGMRGHSSGGKCSRPPGCRLRKSTSRLKRATSR